MSRTDLAAVPTVRDVSVNTSDSVRRWSRTIGHLRQRASKLRRGSAPPLDEGLVEDLIEVCTNLLFEVAGSDHTIQELRSTLRNERDVARQLFQALTIPWVCTDATGRILEVNAAGATMLNVSIRHLVTRELLHFSDNRQSFEDLLRALDQQPDGIKTTLTLRPRERATILSQVTVVPHRVDGTTRHFWFFLPDESMIQFRGRKAPNARERDGTTQRG